MNPRMVAEFSVVPGAAQWGLYKTTDGGAHGTFIHNGSSDRHCELGRYLNTGPCSHVECVVRCIDQATQARCMHLRMRREFGGRMMAAPPGRKSKHRESASTVTRAEFAVNKTPGWQNADVCKRSNDGTDKAAFFRADDVAHGSPTFTHFPATISQSRVRRIHMCTGQCWYDNLVVSPAGTPDLVYVLGLPYQYGETGRISNGRGWFFRPTGYILYRYDHGCDRSNTKRDPPRISISWL